MIDTLVGHHRPTGAASQARELAVADLSEPGAGDGFPPDDTLGLPEDPAAEGAPRWQVETRLAGRTATALP